MVSDTLKKNAVFFFRKIQWEPTGFALTYENKLKFVNLTFVTDELLPLNQGKLVT